MLGPVETDHLADTVAEVVIRSLGEIVDRIAADIQGARRDFVQMRFPDVGAGALDEGDLSLFTFAYAVAQLGCQLEPCGPPPTMTMWGSEGFATRARVGELLADVLGDGSVSVVGSETAMAFPPMRPQAMGRCRPQIVSSSPIWASCLSR